MECIVIVRYIYSQFLDRFSLVRLVSDEIADGICDNSLSFKYKIFSS